MKKTNIWYCVCVESKIYRWNYLQVRNRLTDIENKLTVTKWEKGWGRYKLGVWDLQIQITIHKIGKKKKKKKNQQQIGKLRVHSLDMVHRSIFFILNSIFVLPLIFPGGPVIRTRHFYFQVRFNPWSGNQDPTSCVAKPTKKANVWK